MFKSMRVAGEGGHPGVLSLLAGNSSSESSSTDGRT